MDRYVLVVLYSETPPSIPCDPEEESAAGINFSVGLVVEDDA